MNHKKENNKKKRHNLTAEEIEELLQEGRNLRKGINDSFKPLLIVPENKLRLRLR